MQTVQINTNLLLTIQFISIIIRCVYFFGKFVFRLLVFCVYFVRFDRVSGKKKTQLIFMIQKWYCGILSFSSSIKEIRLSVVLGWILANNERWFSCFPGAGSWRCSWEVPLAFAMALGGQINSPTTSFSSGCYRHAAAQSEVQKSSGIRPPDGVPSPRDEQQAFRRFPTNGNNEIMTPTSLFSIIIRGQRIRLFSGSKLPAARETSLRKFQAGVIFRETPYIIQGVQVS